MFRVWRVDGFSYFSSLIKSLSDDVYFVSSPTLFSVINGNYYLNLYQQTEELKKRILFEWPSMLNGRQPRLRFAALQKEVNE